MRCEQPTESLHFPSHSLQSCRRHSLGSVYSGAKGRAHSSFSAGRPEDFQPRFKKQNKTMVCYSHEKGRRIPNLAELLEKKATFRKADCGEGIPHVTRVYTEQVERQRAVPCPLMEMLQSLQSRRQIRCCLHRFTRPPCSLSLLHFFPLDSER